MKFKLLLITILLFQFCFGQNFDKSKIIGTWQLMEFDAKDSDDSEIEIGPLVLFDANGDTLRVEEYKPVEVEERFKKIYLKIDTEYLTYYFRGLGERHQYSFKNNTIDIQNEKQLKIINLSYKSMMILDPEPLLYKKVDVDLSDFTLIEN